MMMMMTTKRRKKHRRWHARLLERAINAALAKDGYAGPVRVRITDRETRWSTRNIRRWIDLILPRRLAVPKDDEKYKNVALWVNLRLATFDGGLPRQEVTVECPHCHAELPMLADPQEWTLRRDGRWRVTGYWGALTTCEKCELLIADNFERTEVYDLSQKNQPAAADAA